MSLITSRSRAVAALASFALAAGTLLASAAPAAEADEPGQSDAGRNVALADGVSVSASGQETDGQWGPDLAVDGIGQEGPGGADASRWSSNHADDAWITIGLAEPTQIDHVAIQWEDACAAEYVLQVSDDGENFTDATETITPRCGTRDVEELTEVDADHAYSYVRMQAMDRTEIGGQKWGVSLWEFEVWDGAEPVEPVSAADRLVPKPEKLVDRDDEEPFVVDSDTRIVADDSVTTSARFLATVLRGSTGFDLPVVSGEAHEGDIVFRTGDVSGHADEEEAYALEVTAKSVRATASTDHGAFNAVQTIRQLLPAFVESHETVQTTWSMPAVSIVDAPRFSYRGVMLDPARSFLTVDEVKSFIDTMAAYKLSTLHFHLADDQGWRIQITNDGKEDGDPIDYSQLTSVSGQTAMTNDGYRDELGHTGYYTQKDFTEIVEYAQSRHITLIPEIDAPSHTNAALHAIPELNTEGSKPSPDESGTVPANGTGDVGYSTLDVDSDVTWMFMRHVLGQLAELTPGDYLHVGGDESHSTAHDDYVRFITKSVGIVHDLGKKMIGWNEAAVGGLEAGDGLQYWTGGTDDTLKAVKDLGAKLVVSRESSAYLDQKYNAKTPIGLSWAGGGGVETYYNWDPASVVQDAGENLPDSALLGPEGPMWSETIRGGDQAQFLAYPRAMAIAEIGWTPQSERDVDDFTARIAAVGERLLAAGTNFYDEAAVTWTSSMAGTPVAVSPARELDLTVAQFAAPGTKVSKDGRTISVDSTDDDDGVSASDLEGDLTATIDWGDGTDPEPAEFTAATARTSLSAGGLYEVGGNHAYSDAGSYTGTVTASDGTETSFSVSVAEGTPDPEKPDEWDSSVTPKLTVDSTVKAGDRLAGELSGFKPGSYVTMSLGDSELGTVRPDENGEFALSLPIDPGTYGGDYTVSAESGDRRAEASVTVDSDLSPLEDRIDHGELSVVDVDSEETSGKDAPAENAIDGDPETYWHTRWFEAEDDYDHWIVLDLGDDYDVTGFAYTQRPGQSNGRMKSYDVYVSTEAEGDWGKPVATGEFLNLEREQVISFDEAKEGRYLKLVGHDSINGNAFGGAAEIAVGGTVVDDSGSGTDPGDPGDGDGDDGDSDAGEGGSDDGESPTGESGSDESGSGESGSSDAGSSGDDASSGTDGDASTGGTSSDASSSDGAEGELPWTGASVAVPLGVAGLALLGGAVLIHRSRRRRRNS